MADERFGIGSTDARFRYQDLLRFCFSASIFFLAQRLLVIGMIHNKRFVFSGTRWTFFRGLNTKNRGTKHILSQVSAY